MNWTKKCYDHLKTSLTQSQFITFYGFRIKKILNIVCKYYFPVAGLFISLFSIIYYLLDGLTFSNVDKIVTFLDCIYFSATTFFTIGYGDLYAYTASTKILVILQEILSFIILTLFSGFIIPVFFVRRNDVSFHDQLYICFNGDTFTLSFPILNKGSMFYEMEGSLSLTLSNKGNVVSRYSLINIYTTWFKSFWFCDFEISKENATNQDYMVLYEVLYLAITEQIDKVKLPKIKLCIHGIDSQTRGIAYFIEEYYLNGIHLLFSYTLDPTLSGKEKNSNSFPSMNDQDLFTFMKLFQQIVFPKDKRKKTSITGLFEIENKHLDQLWKTYRKKEIFIPK